MHRGKRGAFDWGGVAAVERLARALADPRTGPRRGMGSLRVRRETAFLPAGCPAGGGGGSVPAPPPSAVSAFELTS